jgi:hypothetical protein
VQPSWAELAGLAGEQRYDRADEASRVERSLPRRALAWECRRSAWRSGAGAAIEVFCCWSWSPRRAARHTPTTSSETAIQIAAMSPMRIMVCVLLFD